MNGIKNLKTAPVFFIYIFYIDSSFSEVIKHINGFGANILLIILSGILPMSSWYADVGESS